MKTLVLILVTALAQTGTCRSDDPTSPAVVEARSTYESTLQTAKMIYDATVDAAKHEYLKQLQIVREEAMKQQRQKLDVALEAAFQAKDLKKATELDVAIKSISENSISGYEKSPIAVTAKQTYLDAIQSAKHEYEQADKNAVEQYLMQLESSFDTTFAAKDLAEANRIDAAIKLLKLNAKNRAAEKSNEFTSKFLVENWAADLGSLSSVTVGPGGDFGTDPYVYQMPKQAVLRVIGKDLVQSFSIGFPPDRPSRIIFDAGEGSGGFQGDMFVSSPQMAGGEDLIYRVNLKGDASVFFSSTMRLTRGIAFGRDGKTRTSLYAINASVNSLLKIPPTGRATSVGSGIVSRFHDDDLLITSGPNFGANAYMTDGDRGKLLRMRGHGRASDFANIPHPMSIAQGEGAFGDFLYVGTALGHVYRVSPTGEATLFLKEFAVPPDADIRGIDVANDKMWLATDAGTLLRVIPAP